MKNRHPSFLSARLSSPPNPEDFSLRNNESFLWILKRLKKPSDHTAFWEVESYLPP